FVDESPVARVSIDNKETTFVVVKIRVASGDLHVLWNSQIIFWIPTDQKAMFFTENCFPSTSPLTPINIAVAAGTVPRRKCKRAPNSLSECAMIGNNCALGSVAA